MFVIGEKYHYEKSIVINAPAEKCIHISILKAFNEWNPWMKLDPQLQSTYSGVSGQIGDKHCWKSDKKKRCGKWLPRNHSTYSKSETKH